MSENHKSPATKRLSTRGQKLRDMAILIGLALIVALPGLTSIAPIDRDESRYVQATTQMLETGDYVDIRFQQNPRWKKPPGAYWAQALSVTAFSDPEVRAIWAHRIPSVMGALLAALATYLAGLRLVGRQAAFYGAAFMAVSLSLTFEAHSAKTDALLAGFTTICFAALTYLRHPKAGSKNRITSIVFWAALGIAVMIKGPIAPGIIITAILMLSLWERKARWLSPLLFPLGPLMFVAIIAPWTYMIYEKTGGAFFSTAIGEDLAPKLSGAAEKHPGPPGYYLLTGLGMFWPGILFVIPGLSFAVRALRNARDKQDAIPRAARFMLCWVIPFWVIFEITPTKLPHYTLPLYPALALMAGAAAATLIHITEFSIMRRISAVIYALVGIALLFVGIAGLAQYGPQPTWEIAIAVLIILTICAVLYFTWTNKGRAAVWGAIASGLMLWPFIFGAAMPRLDQLRVSHRVAQTLNDAGIDTPLPKSRLLLSTQFSEPSLVYALGTHILIGGDTAETIDNIGAAPDDTLLIIDTAKLDDSNIKDHLQRAAQNGEACFNALGVVKGYNYSKGDPVALVIMERSFCPQNGR